MCGSRKNTVSSRSGAKRRIQNSCNSPDCGYVSHGKKLSVIYKNGKGVDWKWNSSICRGGQRSGDSKAKSTSLV